MSKLPVPIEAILEDRLAIVGTAGSGKTYAAGLLVERVLADGHRAIIVDPLGVWYGLRLRPDGVTPSRFNPVIFGGKHGDLSLTENGGQVIGEAVAGMAQSCILDLSQFGTAAAERRFMLAFLTALYRNTTNSPVHVIFDEADMWCPQVLYDREGDSAKLLGMMETIVRRGRVKGFLPWLITQRPAVVSKNVLSQADGIIAMKLTSSQDRDAIGSWVEGQADKGQWKALYGSLAEMQRGEGIIWIPGRGVMEQGTFPAKVTFDSSRTPKRGETVTAVALKAIDIGALRERLAKVEEETKANDPKALRAEISRLRGELLKVGQKAENSNSITEDDLRCAREDAYKEGLSVGHRRGSHSQFRRVFDAIKSAPMLNGDIDAMSAFALPNIEIEEITKSDLVRLARPPAPSGNGTTVGAKPVARSNSHTVSGSGPDLTVPQQKIMRSLIFWFHMDKRTPSREQVAAIAGYSPGSGNFNNLLGQLKAQGFVNYPQPGLVSVIADTGFFEAMDKAEARSILMDTLSAPQKKIIEAANSLGETTRDAIAERTGYSAGSGNFNNLLGALRTIGVIEYPMQGQVKISDWAQEVLA